MPKEGDINNPSGKGGFGENPQNRSNGTWSKETSISYWYNHLIRLNIEEFKAFEITTMAQRLAYNSIIEAESDLPYLREVTDRTDGKSIQQTDITSGGERINTPIFPTNPLNGE